MVPSEVEGECRPYKKNGGTMNMLQLIAIIAGTIGILLITWFVSVKYGRYHGLYRFFAFESMLIMTILNLRYWFVDPFSPVQTVSWILLFASIPIVLYGVNLLVSLGKPPAQEFEATTKLVTTGIYKYIRHPMYCSFLVFGFGVFFKHIDLIQIVLVLINMAALYFTARVEEGEMTVRFGEEYREYMKKTKMFVPFIM
jgi:protein-S-isoprenylcysteine O-methyltransferase Ste14